MEWISKGDSKRTEENEIFVELKEVFRSKTLAEWEEFSVQVDCCMAPVLETGELTRHKYVSDRKLIRKIWGKNQVITRCPELGVDLENATPPPRFNEHKHAILSKLGSLNR